MNTVYVEQLSNNCLSLRIFFALYNFNDCNQTSHFSIVLRRYDSYTTVIISVFYASSVLPHNQILVDIWKTNFVFVYLIYFVFEYIIYKIMQNISEAISFYGNNEL